MTNTLVSVCLGVYGNFDYGRLFAAVQSVRRQTGVACEIIVSEQNLQPRYGEISRIDGVSYIFVRPTVPIDGSPIFRPGMIRNAAVKAARGKWVYMSDADIVFWNPTYLAYLIERWAGKALIHPPMIRLNKGDVPHFTQDVFKNGLEPALNRLVRHNRYVVTCGNSPPQLKIAEHRGRVLTTDMESYARFKANPALKPYAPTIWFETVHYGGTFVTNEQVRKVHCYCNQYETWGHEDTDLHWKLGQLFGTDRIPETETTFVIHLDHDKEYFSPTSFSNNSAILERRKQAGIAAALHEDAAT